MIVVLCKTDNLEIKSFRIPSLNEMKYPQNDFHKDVRSESFSRGKAMSQYMRYKCISSKNYMVY